jgi:predicted O-methyltransferase YrrM
MKGNTINRSAVQDFVNVVKATYDREGSDKTLNQRSSSWGHSYQNTYASQFIRLYARHIDGHQVHVVEVGVARGASMRAMRRLIPFAKIYGIDTSACKYETAGATIVVGDGYANCTWDAIPSDCDLIIDDGSHNVSDMLRGIPVFIDHLRPGGVLLIEDIQSAADAGAVLDRLPGSELVDTRDNGRYDDLTVVYTKAV